MRPQKAFEFPDGYNSNYILERFRMTEALFNPSEYLSEKVGLPLRSYIAFITSQANPDGATLIGIQQLIAKSLQNTDVDARPTLLNNVLLTGGSTLLPHFADRINNELLSLLPGVFSRGLASC